ncbi:MAG: peptidase, partial [Firmicutes bacterium]|nr:peptidase [Bacillota bacterium]
MQQWIDDNFEAHLALLKTLAAIPAPSHHEEKRAGFILDWLVKAGANDAYIDQAMNVILPFACEDRDDITVYMAHTDVVFPDLTALPVRQEDNLLYAPGVG